MGSLCNKKVDDSEYTSIEEVLKRYFINVDEKTDEIHEKNDLTKFNDEQFDKLLQEYSHDINN